MHPLSPTRPTELTSALMENELLRYEVRHLQALLSEATGEFPVRRDETSTQAAAGREPKTGADRTSATEPPKQQPDTLQPKTKVTAPPPEVQQRNQQAYDDVVWLVKRLDSSAVGGVLRRWDGFRTMRERYLGADAATGAAK